MSRAVQLQGNVMNLGGSYSHPSSCNSKFHLQSRDDEYSNNFSKRCFRPKRLWAMPATTAEPSCGIFTSPTSIPTAIPTHPLPFYSLPPSLRGHGGGTNRHQEPIIEIVKDIRSQG
jgi:hypothetical protein